MLGADSVIDLDGEIISKPKSREEAFNILKKMNGKSHFLISSVCISQNGNMIWNYTDQAELVMKELAIEIVKDGEGATKIIKLTVVNSKNLLLAHEILKRVSNSLLVKTAMFGQDSNWGRIIASLGSINSKYINPNKVNLYINNILCFKNGVSVETNNSKLKKSMLKKNTRFQIAMYTDFYRFWSPKTNPKSTPKMTFSRLRADIAKVRFVSLYAIRIGGPALRKTTKIDQKNDQKNVLKR